MRAHPLWLINAELEERGYYASKIEFARRSNGCTALLVFNLAGHGRKIEYFPMWEMVRVFRRRWFVWHQIAQLPVRDKVEIAQVIATALNANPK